jgi:autotransporter-associated beta strand protein
LRAGSQFGPDRLGGSLSKIGTGTLVLSGQSTNTGVTTMNAGKLIINGSALASVLVNGGTLGGTGTTGATNVGGGATLSPGDEIGVLHVSGDLTLNLGAIYLADLNGVSPGTGYDQTAVAGAVALDGAILALRLGFELAAG